MAVGRQLIQRLHGSRVTPITVAVMNERLSALVHELYADGVAHDAAQPDRLLKRRNLEPATADLLGLIVRIAGARQVVEIGTGNGYSTVCLRTRSATPMGT